jgi:hypothetical protein
VRSPWSLQKIGINNKENWCQALRYVPLLVVLDGLILCPLLRWETGLSRLTCLGIPLGSEKTDLNPYVLAQSHASSVTNLQPLVSFIQMKKPRLKEICLGPAWAAHPIIMIDPEPSPGNPIHSEPAGDCVHIGIYFVTSSARWQPELSLSPGTSWLSGPSASSRAVPLTRPQEKTGTRPPITGQWTAWELQAMAVSQYSPILHRVGEGRNEATSPIFTPGRGHLLHS